MPLDLAVSPRAVPGCEQCYDVALMDRYPADDYCEDRLSLEELNRKMILL